MVIRSPFSAADATVPVIGVGSATPPLLDEVATAESRTDHLHEFLFSSVRGTVRARGGVRIEDPAVTEGPVVGAIPFDSSEESALFRPELLEGDVVPFVVPPAAAPAVRSEIEAVPSREQFIRLVRSVVAALQAHERLGGTLRKIVLARRLDVTFSEPIDPELLAGRLRRDRHVTTFMLRTTGALGSVDTTLVGATPELLVEKSRGQVRSVPLAGSAPRNPERSEDEATGQRLLQSFKDREEHRLVVEYVLDTLAPLCSSLSSVPEPTLSRTDTMWHLATPIEGRLLDRDTPSLSIARRLHPTPAVCGVPSAEASELISELEPFSRGLYGGAVGWSDASGDGRWMVTLRCAEIDGCTASLHAGAGILSTSDPVSECEETSAKFRALLSALGVEEAGPDGEDR